MENKPARLLDVKPASFDDRRVVKMNSAQTALINFIKDKADKGEVITKDDLLDFYVREVKGSEYYKAYGTKPHPNPQYTHQITDYDNYTLKLWRLEWNIKSQAIQWFKNNLGGCILKGKLLAIPVIEIGENK